MIEIGRENQFYGFAHEGMQACCTARDGDVLRFHTQDCYGDLLTREDIRRADIGDRAPKFNPTTGPVYIEGANPGDTLAVEILDIVPGVRGAWIHEAGGSRCFIVTSIEQKYYGHATQAAAIACSCQSGALMTKYSTLPA